jgi:hypothetical protein
MIEYLYDLQLDKPLDSFLNAQIKNTVEEFESKSIDLNTLGNIMSTYPSLNLAAKGGTGWKADLWLKVKIELHSFLCESNKKYSVLNKELQLTSQKTSSVIIPIISAFLAKELSIFAGVILPFIILFFKISLKISKESLCAYWKEKLV